MTLSSSQPISDIELMRKQIVMYVDQDVGPAIPQVKTNHLAVCVTPPMSSEVQVYICHSM